MFDWNSELLCTQYRGFRTHLPPRGDVSCDFSSCSRSLGYILELQWRRPFETPLCSAKSRLLSSYDGQLRNLN